ncbi:MAG TPA: DUF4062 domain-containing protein [Isosphaeraceae bacterium]|nr:DUF4062 domain-containing protein [Isosphaeraceae bacterium]
MATTWQTARVFISSTFRDMHAERDHLVKVVFPELRERLLPRRIELIDIDLRWGITEEEAKKDRVLDLCLELIDECGPFFLGILGERYGWVPDGLRPEELYAFHGLQAQTPSVDHPPGAPPRRPEPHLDNGQHDRVPWSASLCLLPRPRMCPH